MNGTSFRLPGGSTDIWGPGCGVLVTRLTGHGHGDFANPIIEHFEQALASHYPVAMFFDAGALNRYDSELRTQLTQRFAAQHARIARIDVLVRSRMVAMGVSVAGLALRGLVKSHAAEGTFRDAIEVVLRERHVVGFSPGVLTTKRAAAL